MGQEGDKEVDFGVLTRSRMCKVQSAPNPPSACRDRTHVRLFVNLNA